MKKIEVYTKKIHDILELIKIKPLLFLTKKSITNLEDFINGYMVFGNWGVYERSLIYNESDLDLNEFRFWLHNKPYIPLSTGPRLSNVLLNKTNGNEEKAFDLFYELLDEFKKIKNEELNS